MHVIYNSAGQIYMLHGTEDSIAVIEKASRRENATLKGFIVSNEKGRILELN
ncbi:MAG TPA: hypothetical protein VGA95_08440 [Thermodesulfobacteriota bacterium]